MLLDLISNASVYYLTRFIIRGRPTGIHSWVPNFMLVSQCHMIRNFLSCVHCTLSRVCAVSPLILPPCRHMCRSCRYLPMYSHSIPLLLTSYGYATSLWQDMLASHGDSQGRGVGTKNILGGGGSKYSLIYSHYIIFCINIGGAAAPSAPSFLRHCKVDLWTIPFSVNDLWFKTNELWTNLYKLYLSVSIFYFAIHIVHHSKVILI